MSFEWREINPDYIVSSDGRVASRRRGKLKMLKPARNSRGYMVVGLCDGNERKTVSVHSLVAKAFHCPKPTTRHQVNHKNGVKGDNRAENLEWVTSRENTQHTYDVLGRKAPRGESNGQAKLTEADVRGIRKRYASGDTQAVIAADYGIAPQTVGKIVSGETWAWVDTP